MKTILLPLAAAAVLALSACDTGNPAAPPAPTGLRLYGATGGPVLNITSARISTTLGQEFQFFARVQLANSDEADVSSYAQWTSSNDAVVTVSETGVVRTVGLGEAQVTATFLEHAASATFQIGAE